MRLAIIADIHGNQTALEAVLGALAPRQPDRYVVLGDLAYKGPHPREVVRTIRGLDALVIRGTSEDRLAGAIGHPGFTVPAFADADQFNHWANERLSADDRAWLAELPFDATIEAGSVRLYFVHACPENTTDLVYPWADEARLFSLFGDSGADAVLYGHIHQPYLRWIGGRALINPGSVGQPFDGDRRASCALIEAGQGELGVEFIRVPYDYERVVADARRLGLPAIDTYEAMIRGARWPY